MQDSVSSIQLPDLEIEDVSDTPEANIHTMARLRVRAFRQDLQLTTAVAVASTKTQILDALPPVPDDRKRKLAVGIEFIQYFIQTHSYTSIHLIDESETLLAANPPSSAASRCALVALLKLSSKLPRRSPASVFCHLFRGPWGDATCWVLAPLSRAQ